VHPRLQGDFGELSAAMWLASRGAKVSRPIGHCPDYDLVADFGDRLVRVEVKTCTRRQKNRWSAQLCTHGGNQSWTGTVKLFDRARCDFVFVQVGDGRRWFIPTDALEAVRSVTLGGPKYAEYEVERGQPLPSHPDSKTASTIACP
jgi:Holliday junction resolvase-like predicted endonuclease